MGVENEISLFESRVNGLDWSLQKESETEYLLSKLSPAGHDFNVLIRGKTVEELIESIYSVYEGYDVSYETYIWLDNTGHGRNGAPYELRDVLEDMEACEEMLLSLYNTLIREDVA